MIRRHTSSGQLSDITRVGYVKSKMALLYHAAGVTFPEILAQFTDQNPYDHFDKFIIENKNSVLVPGLKDLEHNIENA